MGIGGALIFPTTLSILTNTFVGRERAKAIGIWAGVSGLGIVIGPLGGGLLLEHFSWGSVFLVNVPICITAIVLGVFFVPDSHDPEEGQLDPLGAVLSIIGLSGLLYGIIEAPDKGWGSPTVLTAFAIGIVVIGAFFAWELHNPHPMLDIRFFKNPRFSAASATITLTYFALFGSTFLLTQYFQFVLGYSPLKAGMMTAPVAIGIMVSAPQAPKLVDRFGTKKVVAGGLLVVAFALCLYTSDTIMSSVVFGAVAQDPVRRGHGLHHGACYGVDHGLAAAGEGRCWFGRQRHDAPDRRCARRRCHRQCVRRRGFHSVVGSASQVPESARGRQSRDSIGAALDAARNLPGFEQAIIREVVDHAYVVSMRLAFGLAALVILLAADVTWRYLPAHAPDEVEEDFVADRGGADSSPCLSRPADGSAARHGQPPLAGAWWWVHAERHAGFGHGGGVDACLESIRASGPRFLRLKNC